jgi:aspartate/glutamate racemase
VNIIEVAGNEIRSRGYKRVALFGTRFVVESRMFGMLDGVDVVVPDQVDAIHNAYMNTVEGGSEGRDPDENRAGVAGRRNRAGRNGPGADL